MPPEPSERIQLLVLERRDAARNMARFYVLSIEPTLFGGAALVREWGRLGTRGRRRLDLFQEEAVAREALSDWLARKLQRGYCGVQPANCRSERFRPERVDHYDPQAPLLG